MTDAELDAIEAALHVALPAEYRRVSRAFPFQPIGHDSVYWMYDDPARVIAATRHPLDGGDYDGAGWRPSYVVIGHGPAGDPYLLDTAAADGPVYYLCHETHAIAVEYPTFAAFVDAYRRAPDDHARQPAAGDPLRAWWRRWRLLIGVIVFVGVLLPLLFFTVVGLR